VTSSDGSSYVHLGIMVRELEPAIARFEQLGLTFMEPRSVHVDRLVENGRETELDLRIAFSLEGPPHWELLEAVGDGIYGPQHVGGIHHVAVLHPDPEGRLRELERDGFRLTAAQYRPDGSMIVGYLDPADLDGARIELIHAPVQDAILAWIVGEDATP
jgi:catechol 2,3-dioxygenase-like lactoylglutathione lyase family enzyme